MTVYVDYGLFSDPLSKYANRSRYNLNYEEIDGQKAKTVVFDHEDGSHFVAVHFQELVERRYGKINKLTLIVEASVEVGREIPQQIIRSIRFLGGHNEH